MTFFKCIIPKPGGHSAGITHEKEGMMVIKGVQLLGNFSVGDAAPPSLPYTRSSTPQLLENQE